VIPSILGGIIGVIFALVASAAADISFLQKIVICVIYAYIGAGIPWGWFVISFIQPKMFLFMSYFGWIVYFSIKILLATFAGLVVMPIGVANIIIRNSKANQIKKTIVMNNK